VVGVGAGDKPAEALKYGVAAHQLDSSNSDEHRDIYEDLTVDRVDLLLISPERLANPGFWERMRKWRIGLLVVDEAHCISEWGHDFRPDYRRIREILALMPPRSPAICTTATANARVMADVGDQMGESLLALRGGLDRPSLRLEVVALPR